MENNTAPFLTIVMATIRPKKILGFLENLNETASDHTAFEVLINVDDNHAEIINALAEFKNKVKFSYRVFPLPKQRGYFSLHKNYEVMLAQSAKSSLFAWIMTDEIRMKTQGWDLKIKKYIDFYKDRVFRLRPSQYRLKNYYSFEECQNSPDNHPIVSRTWLNLTGGWGEFWAPDTWHQCLDFYFWQCGSGGCDKYRSMPIFEFEMYGLENSIGEDGKVEDFKYWMDTHGCFVMSTHLAKENFFRLAHRLYLHIIAKKQGLVDYQLEENYAEKTISLLTIDGTERLNNCSYLLAKTKEDINMDKLLKKFLPTGLLQQATNMANTGKQSFYYYDNNPAFFPARNEPIRILMDALKEPERNKAKRQIA